MNRDPFITNGVYHIFNRGTDKRTIFLDESDRKRFLRSLFEFNDRNPAPNSYYKTDSYEVQPRKKVVEILAYCLMPNHYHLMLRQIDEGGITLFMQKIGTGYTMYFNKKVERSGSLFQGRFKSVMVERDDQLRYLPHYIHANPIHSLSSASPIPINLLRWSSAHAMLSGYPDPVADLDFTRQLYPEGYEAAFRDFLQTRDPNSAVGLALD